MTTTTAIILFTDLAGSTATAEHAGHEAYERHRRQHFAAMREAIAGHRGVEVKTIGDAFMATFPSAGDAVACAIAMQRAQARLNRRGIVTGLRVGVSAGDVTPEERDYFGLPVVEAERLCSAARGGQVLVSDVVRLLDRSGLHRFEPAGQFELKGISEPVSASEVLVDDRGGELSLLHSPFVGRATQLARLREKLLATDAAHGGLVFVAGEPGIGKSRLMEEFAAEVEDSGGLVAGGGCYEGDWAPPYGPFAQAIGALAAKFEPDDLRAALGYGAAPLARLAPVIRELIPDVGEPDQLAPAEEQFRILDVAAQFFVAASRQRPLVLILDDLQWADGGTIAMLRHVARFAPKERLLVVGAYRDVELDREHPLTDALAAMRREAEYELIQLRGLTQFEVAELLALISEHDAVPELAEAISRETDGNPFFVRELLLNLVEEGKIIRQGDRQTTSVPVESMRIPVGVRQVIGRRLARLSSSANRFLAAASAFLGPFPFAAAAIGAGLEESPALDAVDEALDAQILRPAERQDCYEFTHATIRHTLYGDLSPSRQVRLHRRLAEALAQVSGGDPDDSAAEIAYQYRRSASLPGAEAGVAWALRAADVARALYAWEQVVSLLGSASELLRADDPEQLQIRMQRGSALELMGRWADAEGDYRTALNLAGKDAGLRAGAQLALARLDRLRGDYSAALGWLAQAKETHRELEDDAGLAQVLIEEGMVLNRKGEYAQAREPLNVALALARKAGDRPGTALALNDLGIVAYRQADYATARLLHEESLGLKRELGDRWGIAGSLNNLANVALVQGDYRVARALHEESLEIKRAIGDKWGIALSLNNLGIVAYRQGDLVASLELQERSLELKREMGDKWGIAGSLGNLGMVAYAMGDYPTARARFEESLVLCREMNEKTYMAYALLGLGLVGLAENSPEARRHILQSLRLRHETGEQWYQTSSLVGVAALALRDGNPTLAAQLLGAVESALRALNVVMDADLAPLHRQTSTAVRERLGEPPFQSAWEEGGRWSLEVAMKAAWAEYSD